MEKLMAELEKALDETEEKVQEANASLDLELPSVALPEKLTRRQALREQIQEGLKQLAQDGRDHYHPIEPEARRMQVSGRNRYAYNAQAVADAKEGIIVACDVTRGETDTGQLVPMIEQASENVGSNSKLTLGDGGFAAGADLQDAAEKGNDVLAPPQEGKPPKNPEYAAKHFKYDASARTVTCPQGRTLDYEGKTTKDEVLQDRYRCHHRDCPVRHLCTQDPKGRQITITPYTSTVQAMRQRLAEPENKKLYNRRSGIIEPRFALVKEHDGFRRWTVWGKEAVATQWSLICTTLNLRILYRRWRTKLSSEGPNAPFRPVPA